MYEWPTSHGAFLRAIAQMRHRRRDGALHSLRHARLRRDGIIYVGEPTHLNLPRHRTAWEPASNLSSNSARRSLGQLRTFLLGPQANKRISVDECADRRRNDARRPGLPQPLSVVWVVRSRCGETAVQRPKQMGPRIHVGIRCDHGDRSPGRNSDSRDHVPCPGRDRLGVLGVGTSGAGQVIGTARRLISRARRVHRDRGPGRSGAVHRPPSRSASTPGPASRSRCVARTAIVARARSDGCNADSSGRPLAR